MSSQTNSSRSGLPRRIGPWATRFDSDEALVVADDAARTYAVEQHHLNPVLRTRSSAVPAAGALFGSTRANAANMARSDQSSFGLGLVRRSTAYLVAQREYFRRLRTPKAGPATRARTPP